MEQEASDIVIFFGRFHPMILHLPIGFLYIAFILEVLCRFERFTAFRPAVGLTLLLGTPFAVLTALFGYFLAQEGGFNDELLSLHQWAGIAVAILSAITLVLYKQYRKTRSDIWDKSYLFFLIVLVFSITVTGHYGGSLTHGSDYLTEYMPNGFRSITGLPSRERKQWRMISNLQEANVFNDIIHPILDRGCVSCHNESKRKGDLMMQTQDALLKGGESGPAFVAGSVEKSDLMKRLYLPESHDDHMPPKGKRQLTKEEIQLLAWWIKEGAPFDKKVSEITVEPHVKEALNIFIDPGANKSAVEKLLAGKVTPPNVQILERLNQKGIHIAPLMADIHWLKARIPQNLSSDSVINNLRDVSEQLTWLDLGETPTTDDALAPLSTFKNLTRLHLENTHITDAGLRHIKSLPYLEYLNLYGTSVSDKGMHELTGLTNLKRLYVWKTQVTEDGVSYLRNALPEVEVTIGVH